MLNKFSFGLRKMWSLAKLAKQIPTPALAETYIHYFVR